MEGDGQLEPQGMDIVWGIGIFSVVFLLAFMVAKCL